MTLLPSWIKEEDSLEVRGRGGWVRGKTGGGERVRRVKGSARWREVEGEGERKGTWRWEGGTVERNGRWRWERR